MTIKDLKNFIYLVDIDDDFYIKKSDDEKFDLEIFGCLKDGEAAMNAFININNGVYKIKKKYYSGIEDIYFMRADEVEITIESIKKCNKKD